MDTAHQRRCEEMRAHLVGTGLGKAARAMDYAGRHHTGLRKDGTTHEFSHQLDLVDTILALPGLARRQETIITAFLHDIVEDKGAHHEAIIAHQFGDRVRNAVMAVSKKIAITIDGEIVGAIERNEDALFAAMGGDAIASIVKGADRIANQDTMEGVFSAAKQASYVAFTADRILPMLERASRAHPKQAAAYAILAERLETQAGKVAAAA